MNLYLDSSALVKRYLVEDGSDLVIEAMTAADAWFISELGYVEVARAISLGGPAAAFQHFDDEWGKFRVVAVTHDISKRAAKLAAEVELRSLDAIHLASAEQVLQAGDACATWDQRLAEACAAIQIRTVPEQLAR